MMQESQPADTLSDTDGFKESISHENSSEMSEPNMENEETTNAIRILPSRKVIKISCGLAIVILFLFLILSKSKEERQLKAPIKQKSQQENSISKVTLIKMQGIASTSAITPITSLYKTLSIAAVLLIVVAAFSLVFYRRSMNEDKPLMDIPPEEDSKYLVPIDVPPEDQKCSAPIDILPEEDYKHSVSIDAPPEEDYKYSIASIIWGILGVIFLVLLLVLLTTKLLGSQKGHIITEDEKKMKKSGAKYSKTPNFHMKTSEVDNYTREFRTESEPFDTRKSTDLPLNLVFGDSGSSIMKAKNQANSSTHENGDKMNSVATLAGSDEVVESVRTTFSQKEVKHPSTDYEESTHTDLKFSPVQSATIKVVESYEKKTKSEKEKSEFWTFYSKVKKPSYLNLKGSKIPDAEIKKKFFEICRKLKDEKNKGTYQVKRNLEVFKDKNRLKVMIYKGFVRSDTETAWTELFEFEKWLLVNCIEEETFENVFTVQLTSPIFLEYFNLEHNEFFTYHPHKHIQFIVNVRTHNENLPLDFLNKKWFVNHLYVFFQFKILSSTGKLNELKVTDFPKIDHKIIENENFDFNAFTLAHEMAFRMDIAHYNEKLCTDMTKNEIDILKEISSIVFITMDQNVNRYALTWNIYFAVKEFKIVNDRSALEYRQFILELTK